MSTTALALGVVDCDTFAFDQVNGVHPGFGEEQVHYAGAKQIDLARLVRRVLTRCWKRRGDAGRIRHGVVKKLAHQASPGGPGYVSASAAETVFSRQADRVLND